MIGLPQVERVRNLSLWLEAQGLEIVKGGWGAGEVYPMLYVRKHGQDGEGLLLTDPPPCQCGHQLTYHDGAGVCLVWGCKCDVYAPRKD